MSRTGIKLMLAIGALVLMLSGCAGESAAPGESPDAEAEVSSSADSKAALLEVDRSAAPDGANVDRLVSIDEVRTITGMEDVFIAVPAG